MMSSPRFVHLICPQLQTAIISEGFRSLAEGEAVEFDVETSQDGRQKAVNGERTCIAAGLGLLVE